MIPVNSITMTAKPQFRKTKIIATIGPACDDVDTLTQMIRSGMNVARLNLSHGTFEEHRARAQRIREAAGAAMTSNAKARDATRKDLMAREREVGVLRD